MTRPTREQMKRVRELKLSVSSPKSKLLDILRQIEAISPAQARGLERVIVSLECWQTKRSK